MASSRLVLAQRSLSRRTSGESYRRWTGKAWCGGGGGGAFGHVRHRQEEVKGGQEMEKKGNGGRVVKAKQVAQHQDVVTGAESEGSQQF